uniref:Probable transporter MCH1 n=1 Tax=Blastobotrys adeninivorans TaxID=409370 RepID=A0A060TBF3_BLAAD
MAEETSPLLGGVFSRSNFNWHILFSAYLLCILCCTVSGAAPLFSIYTPTLHRKLGYSQLEINTVAIALEAGQYLPLPVIGFFADRYGQSKLGLLSALLLCPGHLIASYVVANQGSYRVLAGCYAAIGTGLASLFFCGLISCTRLYPKSTLLSISAPTTAFGLSALWEAQAIRHLFLRDGFVDLESLYKTFAVFFLIFGLVGFCSAKLAGVDHSESSKEQEAHGSQAAQAAQADVEHRGYGVNDTGDDGDDYDDDDDDDDDYDHSTAHDHLPQKERLWKFLLGTPTWILLLCFVLSSGPLEMYLNNMGAIIDTIEDGPDVALNVSLTAFASTAARLIVGLVSDHLQPKINRPFQLACVLIVTAFAHVLMACGVFSVHDGKLFYLSSLINGFSYGAIFTLVPTIVASVWGLKSFGTNWGTFVIGPAIGSFIYGTLFAGLYDKGLVDHELVCKGLGCYQLTFIITAAGLFVASAMLVALSEIPWKGKYRRL